MKRCKYCNKLLIFGKVNEYGVCDKCSDYVQLQKDILDKHIFESFELVNNSSNFETIIGRLAFIISRYFDYEKEFYVYGIDFYGKTPMDLRETAEELLIKECYNFLGNILTSEITDRRKITALNKYIKAMAKFIDNGSVLEDYGMDCLACAMNENQKLQLVKMGFGSLVAEFFQYKNVEQIFGKNQKMFFERKKYDDYNAVHFNFNFLMDELYKKRIEDEKYIDLALEVCLRDIAIFPYYIATLEGARLPCIKRAINIYAKKGELESAIMICKFAISENLREEISFDDKLKELEKKKEKLVK